MDDIRNKELVAASREIRIWTLDMLSTWGRATSAEACRSWTSSLSCTMRK
jgi:hypothetical protein